MSTLLDIAFIVLEVEHFLSVATDMCVKPVDELSHRCAFVQLIGDWGPI